MVDAGDFKLRFPRFLCLSSLVCVFPGKNAQIRNLAALALEGAETSPLLQQILAKSALVSAKQSKSIRFESLDSFRSSVSFDLDSGEPEVDYLRSA